MKAEIEDFKTGWFGIGFGLKPSEIDRLIQNLQRLKTNPDPGSHFHFRSEFKESGGIGDVEFYLLDETCEDNLKIEGI